MKQNTHEFFRCVSLLAFGAALASGEAGAQQGGLDTIVVTAQKREQSAQEVPIAISAYGGDRLDQLVVADLSGLSNITPNVNLDNSTPFGASQAILTAYIRGIGADDFAFNIDPGVGVYIDGVYLARSVGANQTLLDVERIEILKGPQGTLFGRNTIGGAISVVTRDPADEFAFKGDATYGSDNLFQARMTVEGPITDALAGSISFSSRTRDGYNTRVLYPDERAYNGTDPNQFPYAGYASPNKEGGENSQTVRGKLKWEADRVAVRLSADYTTDKSSQASTLLQTHAGLPFPGLDGESVYNPGPFLDPNPADGLDGFFFASLYNFCLMQPGGATPPISDICGTRGQVGSALQIDTPLYGNPNNMAFYTDNFTSPNIDETYATDPNYSDLSFWGLNGTIDYELNDSFTLKSITGYRHQDWSAAMDLDGSPLQILTVSFDQQQKQFSQEMQLLGNDLMDGRLNLVLGAYYFKEKGDLQDFVLFPEGLLFVDGFNTFETQNFAFFGQVEFAVTDYLTLILGGRYTKEKKEFEGGQRDLNGINYRNYFCVGANGYPDPDQPVAPFLPTAGLSCADGVLPAPYADPDTFRLFPIGLNEKKFDNFSPKVGVQVSPADGLMAYATYSQGYKTGGWTTRLSNPLPIELTEFEEEDATTYEVGFKSRFADNRVQLNAAGFYTEYDGIQLNFQQGISPTLQNAGDAEIWGAEVDIEALLTDQFSVQASVGWLDTEYVAIADAVTAASGPTSYQAGIIVGAELPKAPEWQLNVAPRYRTPLGDGDFILQANFSYASEAWNNTERVLLTQRDEIFLGDIIVTYEFNDKPFTVSAGVKNVGDERYLVTGNSNTAAGSISGTYNRGREWFIRTGVEF